MKRKRKQKQKKQSLTKNIALLFLSIGILAGASVLFSSIKDQSYAPIETKLNKMVSKSTAKTTAQDKQKAEPQKSSMNPIEYSYWDILLLQDKGTQTPGESYSIRIATFRSRESADKYAVELENKTHLRCSIDEAGGKFIVRWGNFHTREVAERYCSTLSGKLQKDCTVMRP